MQINPKLIKRKIATIYLSSNVSNVGANKIPFNSIKSNSDELTLYNNGIKIGKNINKVLISGNVFLVKNRSTYLWTKIFLNSDVSNNEMSVALDNTDSGFASTSHSPRLIDVEEDDVVYMRKIDDDTGELRGKSNTYLTVEVVG